MRGFPRPSPLTRRPRATTPAPPWAPSRRSTTTSASSSPAWGRPSAPSAAVPLRSSRRARSPTASSSAPRHPGHPHGPPGAGKEGEYRKLFQQLLKEGYARVRVDGVIYLLEEAQGLSLEKYEKHDIDLVIDRVVLKEEERPRIAEAVELALLRGKAFFGSSTRTPGKRSSSRRSSPAPSTARSWRSWSPASSPSTAPTGPAPPAPASATARSLTPSSW